MKETGIIRRVDDLGRIVIPKEIRRTQCIREGDALEIYVDDEGITFKKYLPGASAHPYFDAIRNVIRNEMNVSSEVRVALLQQVGSLETDIKAADESEDGLE